MKIAHLADIQIRAYSRHDEYRQSFKHLFAALDQLRPDRVVLAGDILHHKTTLSPEAIDLCVELFQGILKRCNGFDVILGNHDLAMNNLSRMDSISPIIRALKDKHDHLNFMRESGVYEFRVNAMAPPCQYVVMSCIDDEQKWEQVRQQALRNKRLNICLWHGTVNGSILDNGQPMQTRHNLAMFAGMHYVMLGDIHKTQVLDAQRRIAYPGSYPKQSYGESVTGGFFLWDIQDKDAHDLKFIELPTVNPFYTVDASSALACNLQSQSRIRVKCAGLNEADKKKLATQIRTRFNPIEVRFVDETNTQSSQITDHIQIENLRALKTQEDMLVQYVKDRNLTESQMRILLDLNTQANAALPTEDVIRHARYKIEYLAFDNMFSYGKNNVIDFAKYKGVVGIQGKNRCGKSSLAVDVPLYCLYNKISKPVQKNQSYVNEQSTGARCLLRIRLNDHCYEIERATEVATVKKRNGAQETKSATDVSFSVDGKSLNGLERNDTDKAIRSIFGTADDFLHTSVAAQFDLLGFVSDKGADRKKTIARYFDLDLFEHKYKFASDEFRALKREIQNAEQIDYDAKIAGVQEELQRAKEVLAGTIKEGDAIRSEHDALVAKHSQLDTQRKVSRSKIEGDLAYARTNVVRIQREIREFQAYGCISNDNCCLLKRLNIAKANLKKEESNVRALQAQVQQIQPDPCAELQQKINECAGREKKYRMTMFQQTSAVTSLERDIEDYKKKQKREAQLRDQFAASRAFCDAMSKDGIAYNVITSNLAVINNSIAKLLKDTTDFSVCIENDDKELRVFFQETDGNKREIELCSGMEKTIAAIAIRAALIDVTSLPVSNIFILDEALTSLDAENIEAVGRVLHALKDRFDTVFVISHDEYIKDLCDDVIIIEKTNEGFSRIAND